MRSVHKQSARAFTLIEILVVVAIIALLVSILIPTLKKAKEQTRRVVCAAQMHQVMFAVLSYADDHKGFGPLRGYKSYTVAEDRREMLGWGPGVKIMSNLGLLWKKWIGNEHNVLYCPARYEDCRDRTWVPSSGETIGGWKSVFVPPSNCYWSMGGYNYAAIISPRAGPLSSPNLRGAIAFPESVWNDAFKDWIRTTWQSRNPGATFRMPATGVLFTDGFIGVGDPPHSNGKSVNVAYTDGHVRNHRIERVLGSGSTRQIFDAWWSFTIKP